MKHWRTVLGSLGLVVLAFALGAWAGAAWTDAWRPYSHAAGLARCVKANACVGNTVDGFLRHYADDEGGLTAVICEPTEAERTAGRSDAIYYFLPDIVRGRTCQSPKYYLEFRNPSVRTVVTIENGIVTKIELGPLHVIDL